MLQERDQRGDHTQSGFRPIIYDNQSAISDLRADRDGEHAPDVGAFRRLERADAPEVRGSDQLLPSWDEQPAGVGHGRQAVGLVEPLTDPIHGFGDPGVEGEPRSHQRLVEGDVLWGLAKALADVVVELFADALDIGGVQVLVRRDRQHDHMPIADLKDAPFIRAKDLILHLGIANGDLQPACVLVTFGLVAGERQAVSQQLRQALVDKPVIGFPMPGCSNVQCHHDSSHSRSRFLHSRARRFLA